MLCVRTWNNAQILILARAQQRIFWATHYPSIVARRILTNSTRVYNPERRIAMMIFLQPSSLLEFLLYFVTVFSFLTYFNFPIYLLILKILVSIRGPQHHESDSKYVSKTPRVSIVVAAHNHGRFIEEKVKNILSYNYPKQNLEVTIVNDGSTDDTVNVLKSLNTPSFPFPLRIVETPHTGAAYAYWFGSTGASGDFILWTDVDSVQVEEALSVALKHFEDPSVGAVCGIYHPKGSSVRGAELSVKNVMQLAESSLDSIVYATGTFLLFRRKFLANIDPWAYCYHVSADGALVVNIRKAGFRVISDASVTSYHNEPTRLVQQLRRKRTNLLGQLELLSKNINVIFNTRLGFFGTLIAPRDLLVFCLQPLALLIFCVCILTTAILYNKLWLLLFIGTAFLVAYLLIRVIAPRSKVYAVAKNVLIYLLGDLFNVTGYFEFVRIKRKEIRRVSSRKSSAASELCLQKI